MKLLYLDQVGGVSGDMILGAMIGLGVDPGDIEGALKSLGIPGLGLTAKEVVRGGLGAIQVSVQASDLQAPLPAHHPRNPGKSDSSRAHDHHQHDHQDHHHDSSPTRFPRGETRSADDPERIDEPSSTPHGHRPFSEIVAMIRDARLPEEVADNAVKVFRRLGEAEAEEHAVPLEQVQFHEVGAVDSIADIVGSCWCLHALDVQRLVSSPFVFGGGVTPMAHGNWPVPAPATLRLTRGFPVRFVPLSGETVTPTGAAFVTALADAFEETPPMRLMATACGAGIREWPDRPNVLRAILGEVGVGTASAKDEDEVEVLETFVDDMTPQVAAHVAEVLMESGALDVVTVPVLMKKGRPGLSLTILASPGMGPSLADRLFLESPTLGVRRRIERRWILKRREEVVQTPWGPVHVKAARLPDGSWRFAPEYEDCLALSRKTGLSLIEIQNASLEQANKELR